MREALRCVRAQLGSLWPLLRHVCARLSRCPYIIRPYSRASRDVSGLPGPGRSFFFFPSFLLLRVGSSPERRALPARIAAPRCVTTSKAAMGGWKDGRTDVRT